MEDSQQGFSNPQPAAGNQSEPSYWTSVGTAGLIFGVIIFVLSLLSTYSIIHSEPTGGLLSPIQLFLWLATCLIGALGGMLAIWYYEREYHVPITLGRGALIGFLAGTCIALVNTLLTQVWQQFIDPDMMQHFVDSMVANMEASDLPDAQKQQAIDMTAQSAQEEGGIFSQLLSGIPLYGILNLITGMIGVKIFGKKETEL